MDDDEFKRLGSVMETLWNWVCYLEGGGKKPTLKYDSKSGLMIGGNYGMPHRSYSVSYSIGGKTKWMQSADD